MNLMVEILEQSNQQGKRALEIGWVSQHLVLGICIINSFRNKYIAL